MEHTPIAAVIQKPTILVVDDTPETLMLISDLLRKDYKVKVANSGNRALAIAQTLPVPDLILLDIMMPEIDGYEVCRQLKNHDLTKQIPVIFLTGHCDDESKGRSVGAVGYLTKPVKTDLLKASINAHLIYRSHP